ncbi:TetR/AcrR family transcriptional regulator [Streptomyces griseorubiginosus]|uniref:TetR/AcrR family transcriptional regulator n=1 Tax=Streptomyces griseorubiginosus TaxID=67304 RepID=UPI001AD78B74|nr:TetR/AcrR family transcriptional regulator [Streptomyces griseorubiginosus]MBO4256954.1 TetR family transcriptional regulator [Streptomyces griseorubiginosus]
MGTRRAILEAAAEEFGAHGFEDARVRRIAAAAGVSHHLITYYFGGKQGLYEAITEQWMDTSLPDPDEDVPVAERMRRYVHQAWEDPSWSQMLVRERPGSSPPGEDGRAAELLKSVEELRRRQARGEIRGDLDVGMVALAFFAATIAPRSLFWIAREMTQRDPASREFADDYADQIARIFAALAEPPATTDPGD